MALPNMSWGLVALRTSYGATGSRRPPTCGTVVASSSGGVSGGAVDGGGLDRQRAKAPLYASAVRWARMRERLLSTSARVRKRTFCRIAPCFSVYLAPHVCILLFRSYLDGSRVRPTHLSLSHPPTARHWTVKPVQSMSEHSANVSVRWWPYLSTHAQNRLVNNVEVSNTGWAFITHFKPLRVSDTTSMLTYLHLDLHI